MSEPSPEDIAAARADLRGKPSYLPDIHRLLPQSVADEQGILCSFLNAPTQIGALCAEKGLTKAHFHIPAHSLIFAQLMAMWSENEPIDIVTVGRELRDANLIDQCGGDSFISQLFTFLPTVANATNYIEEIQKKHTLREMIRVCTEYAARSYDEQGQVAELLAGLEGEVLALASRRASTGYVPMKKRIAAKISALENEEPDADVIKTGIPKLDELSPVARGDMVVVAAPRKAGKSILAITYCRNVLNAGGAVFYANLEQPAEEQVDRALHGLAKVPTSHNHWTKMSTGEMNQMTAAMSKAVNWRFDLRDDLYDIAAILGAIRQAHMRWPDLALAVVDYCQLVRGVRNKGDTREMEIASISRMLRLCAMELHIAIVLLSQLNKEGDARESMAIEQDMTAMWKLSPPPENDAMIEGPKVRTLSIPRQRKGVSGHGFRVLFRGEFAEIVQCDENHSEEEELRQHPNARMR